MNRKVKLTLWFISVVIVFIILKIVSRDKPDKDKTDASRSSTVEVDNPFVKKYAGAYTAEIKGISVTAIDGGVELYILADNKKAKWMMVKDDGKGNALMQQEQTGTWTATDTKISITANNFTEDYILENGKFVSTVSKDRYLKPYLKNNK